MKAFMDTVEKWLKKMIFIHLLFLIIAQVLLHADSLAPYLNKAIQLEGVMHSPDAESLTVSEKDRP